MQNYRDNIKFILIYCVKSANIIALIILKEFTEMGLMHVYSKVINKKTKTRQFC